MDFPEQLSQDLIRQKATLLHRHQMASLWELLGTVPDGDLVECGVMHGGASILVALHNRGRKHQWMFDSWEGFPPDEGLKYGRSDGTDRRHGAGKLKSDLDECRENFRKFDAVFPNQHFVKGYFSETTSSWDRPISLLRLDGDLYSSTRECLENMEPYVVPGGVVIIDDYAFDDCRKAVREYYTGDIWTTSGNLVDESTRGAALIGVWWRKK